MADIATLGISVTLKDGTVVARQLDAIGEAAARTERRAGSLDKAWKQVSDHQRQAAFADRFATDAAARSMGLAEVEAYKMATAMKAGAEQTMALTNAGGKAGVGLNSLRSSVTAMTASMVQSAPGVAQFTSMLGSMALGSGPMIAVLAGVGALTLAWRAWHEEANKANDKQKELTDSLMKWYNVQKLGVAGEFPAQIDAMRKKIQELKKDIDAVMNGGLFASAKSLGVMGWIRTMTAGSPASMAAQFGVETAKELAKKVAAVKEGGDASIAAQKETNERLTQVQEDAAKKRAKAAKEAAEKEKALWDAYVGSFVNAANAEAAAAQRVHDKIVADTDKIIANVKAMQGRLAGNFKDAQAQAKDAAIEPAKQQEYVDNMKNIWRDGIGRIVTDGFKSFHDFFEDVLQMFSKMMREMERAGKASGFGFKALGIGSAAITGGLAGYGIGQQTGSSTLGALGGAASGALAGGMLGGPIGAAIGGLAGLTGGILGAGKAAREAEKAMGDLQKSLALNLAAIRAELSGDTLGAAIAQVKAQFDALRKQTEEAYAGGRNEAARVVVLKDLNKLEAERTRQLTEEANALRIMNSVGESRKWKADFDDLSVRMLRAQGRGQEADDTDFRNQQNREIERARLEGADPLMIATMTAVHVQEAIARAQKIALEKQTRAIEEASAKAQAQFDEQIRTTRDALKVAEDQLRAQEQAVAATQRVVDSLTQFSAGLKLNTGLTTLSPVQQLVEARKQFDDLLGKANAGNKDAAGNLPGAASAYLTASRAVNASGMGYVADFLRVQQSIEAVTSKFGAQLTVEQQILAAIQQQVATLAAQLATAEAAKAQADANAREQIRLLTAFNDFVDTAPWRERPTGGDTGGPAFPIGGFPTGTFPTTPIGPPPLADIAAAIEPLLAKQDAANVSLVQTVSVLAEGFTQTVQRLDTLAVRFDELTTTTARTGDAARLGGNLYET